MVSPGEELLHVSGPRGKSQLGCQEDQGGGCAGGTEDVEADEGHTGPVPLAEEPELVGPSA